MKFFGEIVDKEQLRHSGNTIDCKRVYGVLPMSDGYNFCIFDISNTEDNENGEIVSIKGMITDKEGDSLSRKSIKLNCDSLSWGSDNSNYKLFNTYFAAAEYAIYLKLSGKKVITSATSVSSKKIDNIKLIDHYKDEIPKNKIIRILKKGIKKKK